MSTMSTLEAELSDKTRDRSPARHQFLTDVLITAVENGGHGWFEVLEYHPDAPAPFAVVVADDDDEDDPTPLRIDLDIIARGLGIIRRARHEAITDGPDIDQQVLHNSVTGQRLYMSADMRQRIVAADRSNEADIDVIDALAIVECGLFGGVTYA